MKCSREYFEKIGEGLSKNFDSDNKKSFKENVVKYGYFLNYLKLFVGFALKKDHLPWKLFTYILSI